MFCFLEDESEIGQFSCSCVMGGEMLLLCLKGLLLFRGLNLKGAMCSQLSLTSMSPSPSASFNGI